MSTTIDERVLEMRFDNKHFEKNVSTTMSTLDKLKQKLNLSGASKGLEGLGSAAKKVDLSGIGNSAETVGLKFNAMYTMADQALRNITNSAMAAGKRIISALTIDPIKTGFSEYETQINAIQTILSNTQSKGTTIDDVNAALDTLNAYADKTIYNFTEMTKNIGTFTAAGIDLETSVNSIQGIANLAAISGSTSQQASTAMYQLSQALASGTVKLMDWNSVVNAGMGGQVFQDALKETARVHGIAIDQMIEENGSFRETLQEGWLTSEVLTETLQKFTMTTEGLSEAQIEANREMLRAKGYTEEQIEAIFALGENATDAATKVKTFTQLWDTLKEAAQSGWTQTWELIIGDFYEARDLLTGISDVVGGWINGMSEWRNTLLGGALGKALSAFDVSAWDRLIEKINTAGFSTDTFIEKLKEAANENGISLDELIEKHGSLAKAFVSGELSTSIIATAIRKLTGANNDLSESLDKAGTYTVKTGDCLWKIAEQYGMTWQELYKLNEELIKNPDLIYTGQVFKVTEALAEEADQLAKLSDEQLKANGYTDEQIQALRALEKAAEDGGGSIAELLGVMERVDGRTLLIESLKNIGQVLIDTFSAAKQAWEAIFNPENLSAEEKMAGHITSLYGMIVKFHDFATSLTLIDENTGKLNETGQKIRRTFEGIFAAVDIVTTILGGGFKIAWKIGSQILSYFGVTLLDVTAIVGDAIVRFHDWLFGLVDIHDVLDVIVPAIKTAVEWVKAWFIELRDSGKLQEFANTLVAIAQAVWNFIIAVKNSEEFKAFIGYITTAATALYDFFSGLPDTSEFDNFITVVGTAIESIGKWITSLKDSENIPADIISGLANGLINGVPEVINAVVQLAAAIISGICSALGIHSPSTVMIGIGGFIIAGLVQGLLDGEGYISETLSGLFGSIAEYVKGIDFGSILVTGFTAGLLFLVNKIANALGGFGDLAGALAETIVPIAKVVNSFSKVLNGLSFKLKAQAIKDLVIALGILVAAVIALAWVCASEHFDIGKALLVVGALAGGLVLMSWAMSTISKSSVSIGKDGAKVENLTGGLAGIAMALLIMGGAIALLGSMDRDQLVQGGIALVAMAGVLVGVAEVCSLINKSGGSIKRAGTGLFKIAGAMLILALVAKIIGTMEWSEMAKAGAGLAGLVAVIALLMTITMIPGKNLAEAGTALKKMAVALLVLVLVAKIIGAMEWSEMAKAGAGLAGLVAVIALLMVITMIPGKNLDKVGSMLLSVAGTMALLTIVAKIIAGMEWSEMAKAAAGLGGLIVIIGLMILVTKIAGKDIAKVGGTLLAISGAMAILAIIARLIAGMEWSEMGKAVVGLTGLVGVVALMILASRLAGNEAPKIAGTLLALSVAIGILAVMAVLLGTVDGEKLAKGVTAISILALAMTAMIWATRGASDCMKNLIVMAVAIGVMAASIGILSKLDTNKVLGASVALSLVMGVFAILMKSTSGIKGSLSSMATLAVMTIAIGALAQIISMLSSVPIKSSIGSAVALSVLVLAMSAAMTILAGVGAAGTYGLIGVGLLLAMAVPLIAFVGVLAAMQGVQGAAKNVALLIGLTAAMTGLLIILTVIGVFWATALIGVGLLLAMAIPMITFVGILALMQGITDARKNAELLMDMMTTMTDLLIKVAIIGPFALLGVAGLVALEAFMLATGALAVAIGFLMDKFPSLGKFLDTGIPVLEKLAYAVGVIAGNLIAGFATGALKMLPAIGLALAGFMAGANIFIAGVRHIDSDVLAGTGYLSASILLLGTTDFIAGIMTLGGAGLVGLGMSLSGFMTAAGDFFDKVSDISPDSLAGVKTLAETILILSAADLLDALTFWDGTTSLESFASQLPTLAKGLAGFKTALAELNFTEDDIVVVGNAADAIKTLATAADSIPNSGGWAGKLLGDNDLGAFAEQFPSLATALASFKTAMADSEFTEADLAAVETAAKAVARLSEVASEIPNEGGWAAKLLGDNDLSTFAFDFPHLATALGNFKRNMSESEFSESDLTAVEFAAKAVSTLSTVAKEIPNEGGWAAKICGDNDIQSFSEKFPAVATALSGFTSNIGSWGEDDTRVVGMVATSIVSLATVAQTIDENTGIWSSFGDNFIAFISKLPELGTYLGSFKTNLGSFTVDTSTIIHNVANTIDALAGVNASSNDGPNLLAFVEYFPSIATKISTFATNMAGISFSSLDSCIMKVQRLTTVAAQLNESSVDEASRKAESFSIASSSLKHACEKLAAIDGLDASTIVSDLCDAVESAAGLDVSGVSTLSTALSTIADNAVTAFAGAFTSGDASETINGAIAAMIDGMVAVVSERSATASTAFTNLVSSAAASIHTMTYYRKFNDAAYYLVTGFVNGILNNIYRATSAVSSLGNQTIAKLKQVLGIASPSKVFYEMGDFAGQGFVNALYDYADKSYNAAAEMAGSARSGLSDSISKVRNMLDSDMDVQPTIRPVLDLSDIRTGMAAMNNMLDIGSSNRVLAAVGSINVAMNRRSQNGGNADVVSAIDKLRGDMANHRGDTYQINGVTYDDGSNISEAVKVIVREAKIQRRR